MSAAEAAQALAEARKRLTELLELVERREPDAASLASGMQRVQEGLAQLGEPAEFKRIAGLQGNGALQAELIDVQRLMAIVSEACKRKSEETVKLLSGAKVARRHLGNLIVHEGRGETCDLSG